MKVVSHMKKTLIYGLLAASSALYATSTYAKGDKSKGKQLFQICANCHGEKGRGNPDTKAPQLAGQYDWYLIQQLKNFQSGIRGSDPKDVNGAMMAPMAKLLKDDQAIEDVVAYIVNMSPKKHN